jgi:hypothetical protein
MIDFYISRRTKTYAAADLVDPDGIKTSFATVTSPVTLVPADFNGAVISAAGALDLPRSVTITRGNNANQYAVTPIVITGFYSGREVTDTFTPANDDGNDTFVGTQLFETITSIAIPLQGGTGGSFLIGVQYIGAPGGSRIMGVELAAVGTLNVGYGGQHGGAPAHTDAIPVAAGNVGQPKPVGIQRVRTNAGLSAPTTVGLTVYIS